MSLIKLSSASILLAELMRLTQSPFTYEWPPLFNLTLGMPLSSNVKKALLDPRLAANYLIKRGRAPIRRFVGKQHHHAVVELVNEHTKFTTSQVKNAYEDARKDLSFFYNDNGPRASFHEIRPQVIMAYIVTHLVKPSTIIETGVYRGSSTAGFLTALHRNKMGSLYSIDLPATKDNPIIDHSNPMGESVFKLDSRNEIGQRVPDEFRDRWDLRLGRSDEILELILNEVSDVDIFLHDSDHSYENMMYEFETVFEHTSQDTIYLSDDVNWNCAMHDFASQNSLLFSETHDKIRFDIPYQPSSTGICTSPQ